MTGGRVVHRGGHPVGDAAGVGIDLDRRGRGGGGQRADLAAEAVDGIDDLGGVRVGLAGEVRDRAGVGTDRRVGCGEIGGGGGGTAAGEGGGEDDGEKQAHRVDLGEGGVVLPGWLDHGIRQIRGF